MEPNVNQSINPGGIRTHNLSRRSAYALDRAAQLRLLYRNITTPVKALQDFLMKSRQLK